MNSTISLGLNGTCKYKHTLCLAQRETCSVNSTISLGLKGTCKYKHFACDTKNGRRERGDCYRSLHLVRCEWILCTYRSFTISL